MNRAEVRLKMKCAGTRLLNQYKIHNREKLWRFLIKQKIDGDKLSEEQVKLIYHFYKPYYPRITSMFHEWYFEKCGNFDVNYIPSDLYFCYIDPYFNNWEHAEFVGNKCMYDVLFEGVKQPETVAFRMNGMWFDHLRQKIEYEEVWRKLAEESEIFIKIATDSFGGHGVYYYSIPDAKEDISEKIGQIREDIMIQRPVKQHPSLARLNDSSVNTIRIMYFLANDGVRILSRIVRIGQAGSKVDNASSGGLTCGITEKGILKKYAYNQKGDRVEEHPDSHIIFENIKINGIEKIEQLIQIIHCRLPHFRLISWDFSVDEKGDPVLIEANINYGGIEIQQLNNGPLFGNETKEILEEVFKTKRNRV